LQPALSAEQISFYFVRRVFALLFQLENFINEFDERRLRFGRDLFYWKFE
jgi:hypothetical protein